MVNECTCGLALICFFFASYLKHRLDAHTQVKVEGLRRNHVLQRGSLVHEYSRGFRV